MIEPNSIICGDALTVLRGMPDECVQMCVTSPPYFGLRSYGTEPLVWGGDSECEHEWGAIGRSHHPGQVPDKKSVHKENAVGQNTGSGRFCQKCGAWFGHLGLEPIPEMYVEHSVEIFREVKRVLKNDGTLWLNLGSSYAGSGDGGGGNRKNSNGWFHDRPTQNLCSRSHYKPKDLIPIPWMVAMALQKDGWWLRCDCIWSKPNAMPSSVTDRPTISHEYLFLLSKSERYYYDSDSIKERSVTPGDDRARRLDRRRIMQPLCADGGSRYRTGNPTAEFRNKRSVWEINTEVCQSAHFATFPTKLIEPCILAGSRIGDVVLDPFGGSGTTAEVCGELGRKYLLIELNPKYVPLIQERARKGNEQINFMHQLRARSDNA